MEIAFVTSGSDTSHVDFESENLSGTESQIYGVATELQDRGHDIFIIKKSSGSRRERTVNGIKVIEIHAPTFSGEIGKIMSKIEFSRRSRSQIKVIDPDVTNVIMKYASFFSCKCPTPVVHFAFNNPASLRTEKGRIARIITGSVENRIGKNVEGLVVRNTEVEKWANEHVSGEVARIPTAIEAGKYYHKEDDQYLIYGGRLSPEKNLDFLLKAFSRLPDDLREKYDLAIVGEGPEKASLTALSSTLGIQNSVTFYPWLPKNDFREMLSKSTCGVLPSVYEGMPVFALEVMASGKPFIGSDIAGIREVVNSGKTGLLFDLNDLEDFSLSIEKMLKSPADCQRMGKSAKEVIERNFTFERVADQYLDLYQKVTEK